MLRSDALARALVASLLLASGASALPVAYFEDAAFVDTARESANLRSDLGAAGHSANVFSGTSDSTWTLVFASASHLVIPELEKAALHTALSSSVLSGLAGFVQGGGVLLVSLDGSGRGVALLNTVFGHSIAHAGVLNTGTATLSAAAAGTSFAGGPATLPMLDANWMVDAASLPAGAISLYDRPATSALFVSPEGAGHVAGLAYDWWAGTDSGWSSALDSSLTYAATPEPSSAALLGFGLGLLAARRIRRAR